MFEWSDAKVFLAAYRGGSLSAAARALDVEQTTVGRRLTALEKSLGAHLFDRTSTGLKPTEEADAIQPRFEAMESEALAMEREVTGRESEVAGPVRLTVPDIYGPVVVAPLLVELLQAQPRIQLELIADNRNLNLSRREADLAVRMSPSTQVGLIVRQIGTVGSGLYASKRYLERKGRPRGFAFEGHDFIVYDDSYQPEPEVTWYLQHARAGRILMRTNTSRAFLGAARAGGGLAIIPEYLAAPYPELVQVLPPAKVVRRTVWLVMHRDLRRAARIRAVADFLVKKLGSAR
ncbi:MAG: LysR family transcriptional regulator [Myxococcaceae bacterium]|nr:LysR family transcriptional regulator [Myxococcaceae bacterium]